MMNPFHRYCLLHMFGVHRKNPVTNSNIFSFLHFSFVGPEILEYNQKYILFTSTESFGSLYLKIKKFELERKTSSIDYIYYNAQNKTYVIKIFRKDW